jgi:magnesium transporter
MISFLYRENSRIRILEVNNSIDEFTGREIIAVDMDVPTDKEIGLIENYFGIQLLSWQKAEEIESSSRYFETADTIWANSNFLKLDEGHYDTIPVSFTLKEKVMISNHNESIKTFHSIFERLQGQTFEQIDGYDIFLVLLDVRIDYIADILEGIGRTINQMTKTIRIEKVLDENSILEISVLQEATMLIRENIVDKQRVMSAILKSERFPAKKDERIRFMLKDTGSLLTHTAFSFERLEFLQNTFLGLMDIEQNKIIKMFSFVAVIFMPPTLIASMYGMNFKLLPELEWEWGYPFAILLMLASSGFTLYYFRRKGWL